MRVVVLCLSPSRGGLELYALEEVRQLIKRGHDCCAVVAPNSYLSATLENENIPYFTLQLAFNKLPLLAAKNLYTILTNFRATTLHFHWGQDLYLAALAKAMAKTISSNKLALVHSRHMNLTRNKKDFFHRWFYQQIDLFLAGTKLLLKDAGRYLPLAEDKIKLLYLGVRAPVAANADCNQFFNDANFKRRRLNLAIFGRIEEGKGQHLVVAALQRMLASGKDISLTLVGHTMDSTYKNKLVQDSRDSSDFVQFKEFVNNAADSMSCFDVIILSTHCETFGLVLIEAMRAGVAVIGTNAGGVPEIIQHTETGMLAEPRNSASMQDCIEQLYNEPELRATLVINAKQFSDRVFSDGVHYEHLEQALQGVTLAITN